LCFILIIPKVRKSVVNGYHELEEEVEDMTATWELLQEELDDDVKSALF
jgi:peptide chain release factor 2